MRSCVFLLSAILSLFGLCLNHASGEVLLRDSIERIGRKRISRGNPKRSLSENLLGTGPLPTAIHRNLESFVVTVLILFDNNPSDIEWTISDEFGTFEIDGGADFVDELLAKKLYSQQVSLNMGSTYRFNIYDAYGDGLRGGYFAVFFGTDTSKSANLLVFSDDFVKAQDSVLFTVEPPTTPAPTPARPTISPQPTHAPSTCVTGGLGRNIKLSPFDPKPKIKSADSVFPTNAFCTSHDNYQSCTNEDREDCQWVFLASSLSTGICRVDPMSKCLETGDCVCYTEDFHGGRADYAGGIKFHAPISITPRDISNYASLVIYQESYSTPVGNDDSKHPHDESFFISKVDFTSRKFTYTFKSSSPMYEGIYENHTIAFKIHYLYMDVPLVGTILRGLGMSVSIDTTTDDHTMTINGKKYVLSQKLRKWTCSSVIITPTTLYVAGIGIGRDLSAENVLVNTHRLILGSFPGELFDVRVYSGTLSSSELAEVGARCTNPNDPAALIAARDIDFLYDRDGCDPNFSGYFDTPTTGGQTYGSGPFATLWVHPREDPFGAPGTFYDVPERELDEEYYFQQYKFQNFVFEKFYFEHDMIGFQLEPYRYFASADQVPEFASSVWNNPCRYMHQNNNLWDFPLYDTDVVPKWQPTASKPDEVFDLRNIFYKQGISGYQYTAHEMFHEFQQTLYITYSSGGNMWLDESSAGFGAAAVFPGSNVIYATMPLSISYPLVYDNPAALADVNAHFLSDELSFSDQIRFGRIYNAWVLWWFLSEHAGMPFLLGQMYTNERYTAGTSNGMLSMMRLYVEAQDMDLGDLWGIFVAHYRTWDFKMEKVFVAAEQTDFDALYEGADIQPPIPRNTTLENRKTTVNIDSDAGTSGQWVFGPSKLRPGPFGWNCLTLAKVASNRVVVIDVAWDDGMGFQANTSPPSLPDQQKGCDDDARFYSNMVVAHRLSTGERRYWKLKGKIPSTLVIETGLAGAVDIHILMVPTPPADYASGLHAESGYFMYPIPIYNYRYKINVDLSVPEGLVLASEEPQKNGIVNFASATEGFWPVRCTCIDDPSNGEACIDPIFPKRSPVVSQPTPSPGPSFRPTASAELPPLQPTPKNPIPQPTLRPTTQLPSLQPTPNPTAQPTLRPTRLPTSEPSPEPPPQPTPSKPALEPTKLKESGKPAEAPTPKPTTPKPKPEPTSKVTSDPTEAPAPTPTPEPTSKVSKETTEVPSHNLPHKPTPEVTREPTESTSLKPTPQVVTNGRTLGPMQLPPLQPTIDPNSSPTLFPTRRPTRVPTVGVAPETNPSLFLPTDISSLLPSPVPTLRPTTVLTCDDDREGRFFVASIGQIQQCVWLAARPEQQEVLCVSSHEAYSICPETCGVCSDQCDDTNHKFDVNGYLRDCEWLSLRNDVQNELCVPSHDAYFACPETCNTCDGGLVAASLPSATTLRPEVSGSVDEYCDDDRDMSFFVSSIQMFQKCVWLAARPDQQAILCVAEHESGAYEICSETCQRCTDDCEDSNVMFDVNGDQRDCAWLNLRTTIQDLVCIPGGDPFTYCPETCGACDRRAPVTPAPVAAKTGYCDDDKFARFFISSTNETQQCVWLAARPEQQAVLCAELDESQAHHLCPETCGKCRDNCRDTANKFDYGGRRDCTWLSLRLNVQLEVCIPGSEAYTACPETCDACDTTT